jgi:hypothetical protein
MERVVLNALPKYCGLAPNFPIVFGEADPLFALAASEATLINAQSCHMDAPEG